MSLRAGRRALEKSKMIAEPRRKTRQDDADHDLREQRERALDEALANTFPASDPVSAEQPVPPAPES
jgi:hypothetical protein